MRILLIEESLELANLISEGLSKNGHKCVTKTSALGALEFLESHKMDLLITELELSSLNGEELCQIVKSKYKIPTLLSANNYAINNSKNFDGFILKPFDVTELLDMISIVAKKKDSRPQQSV